MTAKRNDDEFRLTCLVNQLLMFAKRPGVHYFHVPNGEARSARTGARLKRMGVRAGEPDFVILYNGDTYGLELKAGKNKQTAEQIQVGLEWSMAGCLYHVATGYQEAHDFLLSIGAIRSVSGNKRFEPRSVTEGREAEAA